MTCAPGAYPAGAADRRWARRYLPAARPGFHPQAIACHRVLHELLTPEVRGLDRLPTEGPALVVGNHSCLFYMPEVWTWGQAILSHRGIGAPAHVLAYDLLFALPRVGSSLRRLGVVPASTGEAESALARGACVLVYPGGDREACRPWTQRNKVDFAGRKGFVKLALRCRVPVVPVAAHGGHHAVVVLARGDRLARAAGLRRLRINVFPLLAGPPFGINTILTPPPPMPAHLTIEFLPPLDWIAYGPGAADNTAIVAASPEPLRQPARRPDRPAHHGPRHSAPANLPPVAMLGLLGVQIFEATVLKTVPAPPPTRQNAHKAVKSDIKRPYRGPGSRSRLARADHVNVLAANGVRTLQPTDRGERISMRHTRHMDTSSMAAARANALRPNSPSRHPAKEAALTCDVCFRRSESARLPRGRDLVLVALGELLQVEQLPPCHDQVPNRQPEGSPARSSHDDLEQQMRHVVLLGDQDVGHEGPHDGARQLLPGIDRDDPAQLTPASGGEPIPDLRLRKAHEAARRAAATVVDPVVGVRRQPHLGHPRPHRLGRCLDAHAPPRLHRG